jgi:hypothetical protein
MYEIVEKDEYQPVREQLEDIIKFVQDYIREQFTFSFRLIGSGSRHLITRIKGGNQGFDFDYNLVLNNPDSEHVWNPKYAKETLMNVFREAVKNTLYKDPTDSTSVITIKVVDQKKNSIIHSCDFAIIYYPEQDDSHYYKYVKHNKRVQNYTWEERELSKFVDEKKDWIIDNNHWQDVRDEYLKLKNNNNDSEKKSFSLYHEAVHNVFNWYHQEEEDDDWGD